MYNNDLRRFVLWSTLQVTDIESVVSDVVMLLSRWVFVRQRDELNILNVWVVQGNSHLHTDLVHLVSEVKIGTKVVVTSFDTNELSKYCSSVVVCHFDHISSSQASWRDQLSTLPRRIMLLEQLFMQKFENTFSVSLLGKWFIDS